MVETREPGELQTWAPSSSTDTVFEYWAGNPSVEIAHGHIRTLTKQQPSVDDSECRSDVAIECAGAPCSDPIQKQKQCQSNVILASSVPCYMSATEFCDFIGAFGSETHRSFRHCRVLHGQAPEEYLIVIDVVSADAAVALMEQYDGRQYNSIEANKCELHRVLGFLNSIRSTEEPDSPGTPMRRPLGSQQLRSPHLSMQSPCFSMCPSRSCLHPPPFCLEPSYEQLAEGCSSGVEDVHHGSHDSSTTGEKAFCAVCLEHIEVNPSSYQLTELGGGVPLSILCGHTFHARCLSRWCDATCPVCRFQQHPYRTSCCEICGSSEGLHICLVCGLIGCNATDGAGHAQQHFEETRHTYALELSTQRVWDYSGNGYVHRLLYNHEDGKMVEHSVPPISTFEDEYEIGSARDAQFLACAAATATEVAGTAEESGTMLTGMGVSDEFRIFARDDEQCGRKKKQESIVAEFNALLSSQMTAQRRYYEERQHEQDLEHSCRLREFQIARQQVTKATNGLREQLSDITKQNAILESKIFAAQHAEEQAQKQHQKMEELRHTLSEEQREYEDQRNSEQEQRRIAKQRRARDVENLQSEIRELELNLQMRKRCEAAASSSDLQGSHVVVTEGEPPRRRGGRRRR